MRRKKNDHKLLEVAIVVAVVVAIMIAIAQGAIAKSDETISRIDSRYGAVIDR